MKYAVEYSTPGEEREPRRTRFVSLKMAKKKKEALEHHGHVTRMMPKTEHREVRSTPLGRSVMFRNTSNFWAFIPKFVIRNGKKLYDGIICMKNGGRYPLDKLP